MQLRAEARTPVKRQLNCKCTAGIIMLAFVALLTDSLLVAAPEVNAGGPLCAAADEIAVGACLAGLAVVAVPPDADDGTFLELLS